MIIAVVWMVGQILSAYLDWAESFSITPYPNLNVVIVSTGVAIGIGTFITLVYLAYHLPGTIIQAIQKRRKPKTEVSWEKIRYVSDTFWFWLIVAALGAVEMACLVMWLFAK